MHIQPGPDCKLAGQSLILLVALGTLGNECVAQVVRHCAMVQDKKYDTHAHKLMHNYALKHRLEVKNISDIADLWQPLCGRLTL